MAQASQQSSNAGSAKSNHPVADKMKDTLHDSIDTLSEKAAATEQGLRDSAAKGSEDFAERKEQLEQRWNGSSVKQYAVENPVKTAGIAFAAGALLATILRGK
jgi:ElaB/YqjD/DUF883 family membrane-anchored ribosome-binding protein